MTSAASQNKTLLKQVAIGMSSFCLSQHCHISARLVGTHNSRCGLQLIQRRCPRCSGSGLIERGPFLRKCPECGGFFPWQGWKQFFTSTATPGNGGVLRQPRNQDGVIYKYAFAADQVDCQCYVCADSCNADARFKLHT